MIVFWLVFLIFIRAALIWKLFQPFFPIQTLNYWRIYCLRSRSSTCSSQWLQCGGAWRGSVWLPAGVASQWSRALKAGCCRLGARRWLVKPPEEEVDHYWRHAEGRPNSYRRLLPARNTENNSLTDDVLSRAFHVGFWFFNLICFSPLVALMWHNIICLLKEFHLIISLLMHLFVWTPKYPLKNIYSSGLFQELDFIEQNEEHEHLHTYLRELHIWFPETN